MQLILFPEASKNPTGSSAEYGSVAGKLLVGSEEYSFAAVAAPYAQELLDLQSARSFAITEFGKQVPFRLKSPLQGSMVPTPVSCLTNKARSSVLLMVQARMINTHNVSSCLKEFGGKLTTLQAVDVSLATAAMPGRVAKIEGITRALEQGSLKLRVRDPASERALRRSGIMQVRLLSSSLSLQ